MFESPIMEIGLSKDFLSSGEGHDDLDDHEVAYQTTCLEMADGWVAADRHVLPDGLESIPVGPYLAAVIGSVDRSRLNGHDAVRLMQAESRLATSYEAAKLATMAEVAHCPPGHPESPVERTPVEIEYAASEIAAALTLTRRDSENQLNVALTLIGRLRRVWDRFARGDLSFRKVSEFVRQIGHLDRVAIDEVLDRTLDHAQGLTTGQLRAQVSRVVMETDSDGTASGFLEGLAQRRVITYPNPDFTGTLSIQSAHPTEIYKATNYIDQVARKLKEGGDERDLDQIKTDVALDLLQGKCHCRSAPRGRGRVHLNVDLASLAELLNTPGELGGYGPVTAEIARKIGLTEVDGEWTYTVTNDGSVIDTGTISRRPTTAQRRRAYAEYPTCVFVGCRMSALDCDLDHRLPHSEGGATHNDNLEPLCRHDHMVRHNSQWRLERLDNGDHLWTSPLGHTYLRRRGPPV